MGGCSRNQIHHKNKKTLHKSKKKLAQLKKYANLRAWTKNKLNPGFAVMNKTAPTTRFVLNSANPRKITREAMERLVASLRALPEMLDLRPIVVDAEESMVVLGGNSRLLAAREIGVKELPYIAATKLTTEQRKRFVVADNVQFGEWDYELLEDWDGQLLADYGLYDADIASESDNQQTEDHVSEYQAEYRVVVECDNESHQRRIYDLLLSQGEKCKPMTL